jgi:hypothetical protein
MRRVISVLGLVAAALTFAAVALSHEEGGDGGIKDHHHFGQQALKEYEGGSKAGSAKNMVAVGHDDLEARGFNGDVWVHDGYAYVGQWGFTDWAIGNSRFCPTDEHRGVAVIDVRDPSKPNRVATLENVNGSSAEDVVVYTARFGTYAGRDIAVSGIQDCAGSRYDPDPGDRGLQLWDVTDAGHPVPLGMLDTGCCTRGVHEFEVQHRADLGRTFAYATVPTSRYPDENTPSGYRDEDGEGDFRLIDITDPTDPVQVSDWGIQDIGGPFSGGQGCDPDANYGHGAEPSADGKLVFVSYWDSGFIRLDVSDPANPLFTGRTVYPPEADGDGHSSQYDEARKLLIAADEDFCKTSGAGIEKGFGYLRVYDYSKPSAPKQIGLYKTPNSSGSTDIAAGDFTIHNNFIVGTTSYTSWYTDGVRVIDLSNPRAPREVAHFVPPATTNPVKPSQRGVLTNTTQVWGVVVDEETGLVYASDMNSGLWILKRTG